MNILLFQEEIGSPTKHELSPRAHSDEKEKEDPDEENVLLFRKEIGSPTKHELSPRVHSDGKEKDDPDEERSLAGGGDSGLNTEGQQACNWDLPPELLAKCFLHLSSMKDMAAASMVSHRWRAGVKAALVQREKLSFVGFRIDDSSMGKMVEEARNLLELDIHFNRWGSSITDAGLGRISLANCCSNLKRLSLFGLVEVTDKGIIQLVSRASSLEHFNIGGTGITDASLIAIATSCTSLKTLGIWGCTNITETGLLALAEGCPYLVFLNTGCLRISKSFELRLVSLNPHLRLKPSHLVRLPVKPEAGSASSSVSFASASYHLHSFVS